MILKKTFWLMVVFLFVLILLPITQGSFDVYPRELTISMRNGFIQGNTSRYIEVQNLKNKSINITWYLDHPNPISWIRPNRTLIPNLNWIEIKPASKIIPPGGIERFDIFLDIPNKEENLKKQWETWIVFKDSELKFINFEATVRFLIDSPIHFNYNNNNEFLSIKIGENISIPVVDFIIIIMIMILVSIGLYMVKKRKTK
jgi:hypothetical protein